ncbi:MAG: hypothetical protein KDB14_32205, partial [Planctomycetales bacterium]|nr:hypothetical protein [Planctomycetales bacterium]
EQGGDGRSSVRMSDMDLDGRLDVVLVGASMSASRLTAGEATVQLLANKSGNGEGSTLDMSDADLDGDLSIVGGGGGAVHLSRIAAQTVDIQLEKSGGDLRSSVRMSDMDLDGLHVSGSSSTSVESSRVEGAVQIEGLGSGSSTRLKEVTIAKRIDKSSPILMLQINDSETNTLDDVVVEGAVQIQGAGGSTQLHDVQISPKYIDKSSPALILHVSGSSSTSVESSRVEGAVQIEGLGSGSSTRLKEVTVAKRIDKSSPILMLQINDSGTNVLNEVVVEGDVRVENQLEQDVQATSPPIDLVTGSNVELVNSSITGNFVADNSFSIRYLAEAGDVATESIHISAPSVQVVAQDSEIGGSFQVDSFFDIAYRISSLGDDGSPVVLDGVAAAVLASGLSVGGDFVVDSFFDVTYQLSAGPTGTLPSVSSRLPQSRVTVRDLNVEGDLRLTSSKSLSSSNPLFKESENSGQVVLVERCSVGGGMAVSSFVEVAGDASAAALSHVVGAQLDVQGDLRVADTLDLSNASSFPPGTSLQSSVQLAESSVAGQLVVEGVVTHPARFKVEIDGAPARQIKLQGIRVGGLTLVSQGASRDNVLLQNVQVQASTEVWLGEADDYLRVVDSVFAGQTLFDGGSELELDTLLLRGNQFLHPPQLLDWELLVDEDGDANGRADR